MPFTIEHAATDNMARRLGSFGATSYFVSCRAMAWSSPLLLESKLISVRRYEPKGNRQSSASIGIAFFIAHRAMRGICSGGRFIPSELSLLFHSHFQGRNFIILRLSLERGTIIEAMLDRETLVSACASYNPYRWRSASSIFRDVSGHHRYGHSHEFWRLPIRIASLPSSDTAMSRARMMYDYQCR